MRVASVSTRAPEVRRCRNPDSPGPRTLTRGSPLPAHTPRNSEAPRNPEQISNQPLTGSDLTARVVIACDGVNSFVAKEAGLYGEVDAADYTLGVKEEVVPGAVEVEGWWSPSGRCR